LIDAVLADGGKIAAHDPVAGNNAKEYCGNQIEVTDDPYDAAKGAEALVLVTEWRPYQSPDFDRLKDVMASSSSSNEKKLLIDGRNIWSAYKLSDMGFTYEGIGIM